MLSLINRQCFSESRNCAFRSHVCSCIKLPHASYQARQVYDISLSATQMRQSKLTCGKYADQIQIQQVPKLLNGKIIYRLVRRMPPGVVYQTINLAVADDSGVYQSMNLFGLGDVASHEVCLTWTELVHFLRELHTTLWLARAKYNLRSSIDESSDTALTNSLAATGDDYNFILIFHLIVTSLECGGLAPLWSARY